MQNTVTAARPTFLYILKDSDKDAYKIGVSIATRTRAADLPETIDWSESYQVAFGEDRQAYKAETFFHTFLAKHGVDKGHRGEGHTEWFSAEGAKKALDFIRTNNDFLECTLPERVPEHKPRQLEDERDARLAARAAAKESAQQQQKLDNQAAVGRVKDVLTEALAQGTLLGCCGQYLVFGPQGAPDFGATAVTAPGLLTGLIGSTWQQDGSHAFCHSTLHAGGIPERVEPKAAFDDLKAFMQALPAITVADLPNAIQRAVMRNELTGATDPNLFARLISGPSTEDLQTPSVFEPQAAPSARMRW